MMQEAVKVASVWDPELATLTACIMIRMLQDRISIAPWHGLGMGQYRNGHPNTYLITVNYLLQSIMFMQFR